LQYVVARYSDNRRLGLRCHHSGKMRGQSRSGNEQIAWFTFDDFVQSIRLAMRGANIAEDIDVFDFFEAIDQRLVDFIIRLATSSSVLFAATSSDGLGKSIP